MLNFYQRLGFRCAILLFCFLLVLIGCGSHTVPYYFSDVPENQKGDVELPAEIRYRIILLGDGGDPEKGEPVLGTLGKWAKAVPKKTSIVFLGDNMYPNGLIEDNRNKANDLLGPQLDIVIASQAFGLFIPGNHDWDDDGKDGQSAVMAQEAFINKHLSAQSEYEHPAFLPTGGKPGPCGLELPPTAPVVRLIVLDTQWWLHEHDKPLDKDPETVIKKLKAELMTELPVIVVGHHPIETYGPHGGVWYKPEWVCSLFSWLKCDVCKQDVNGKDYKDLVNRLNQAFWRSGPGRTPLLIYAAGHDHSLQVLRGRTTDYLLVSGAGSSKKISEVWHGYNTLFAHESTGFMVVDFLENDAVLLRVVEPANKEIPLHQWLK